MTLDAPTVLLAIVGTLGPSLVCWLGVRAVKAFDRSVETLISKVDALGTTDVQIQIELATLRARVAHIEWIVRQQRVQIPDSGEPK